MSDPCFTCRLPSCDENSPACAFTAQRRDAQRRYSRAWRRRNPIQARIETIQKDRERAIDRAERAIRGRLAA